jgi:coproporphyrinogen III oxidase-like Fe-S oxidoreductase
MKKLTIRGIVFALTSHSVTKQHGNKSTRGIDRDRIITLAQTECGISAELAEKALAWLDAEGYIKLHTRSVSIRKAGWELAERYIKAFKRWYKQHNSSKKTEG